MKIENLLREAGQHESRAGCGPEVEERLRDAFRRRRRPRWMTLVGAVAAAVALVLWFAPRRDAPQPQPLVEQPVAVIKEAPRPVEPVAVAKPRRVPARRKVQAKEVSTEFFALDAAALNGVPDAYVMRVQVPRATMASFGLPVNQHLDQRIDADLLVGSNGMARAIRFVQYIPVFQ